MNKTLEVLKNIYKPYRWTIKNKAMIIETTSGNFVLKEKKDNNIKELYNYLLSRNFTSFAPLIDGDRKDINVYEYFEEIKTPKEQKSLDLANILADLHNKTTYFKEVSEDVYHEIFDNIKNNILYLKEHYENEISEIKKEVYMAPSHYALIRNSSKVFAALEFCNDELDNWYELVRDKKKQRVALIHNNLQIDHLVKSTKDVLVSWDRSKIDTPVLDLFNFYQNEYFNVHFEEIFNQYNSRYPLNEDEKKLFFILISLPLEVNFTDDEFNNCKIVREKLDYLFKTEELVRPYYTIDEVKE